jgi:hypothetical protein
MLDLLVHPRVPPLVRSLPPVEALALFRDEESNEERAVRQGLGIVPADQKPAPGDPAPLANEMWATTAQNTPTAAYVYALDKRPEVLSAATPSTAAPLFPPKARKPDASQPAPAPFQSALPVSSASAHATPVHLLGLTSAPLPSMTSAPAPLSSPISAPPLAAPKSSVPVPPSFFNTSTAMDDDEEDDPMPTIDMGSDTDEDES